MENRMQGQKLKWGRNDLLLALIAVIPAVAGLAVYDKLPEQMAVHFSVNSTPNNFQGKASTMILFTLLGLGLPLLMKFLRAIDPKAENYSKFERAYDIVRFGIAVLMSGVFGFVLLYNLGYPLNVRYFAFVLIGLLFLVMGNYLGQVRFNYFYGIKTPWTLANEDVWRRTHRMAGPLYMIDGALFLIAAFLPVAWLVFLLPVAIILAVVVPLLYSFVMYKRIVG